MRRAALLLGLVAGCGPSHFLLVANGGIPLAHADCPDVSVGRKGDRLWIAVTPPECSPGDAIGVGAAAVYWRVGASNWAGPLAANQVTVRVPVLASGGDERALSSGERQKALSSGEGQKTLSSGLGEKALSSGAGQRALSSGEAQRALSTGQSERALSAAQGDRALSSGGGERALASGDAARNLSASGAERRVITLEKSVTNDSVTCEDATRFVLRVTNVGAVPLSGIYVVDRVAAALAVDKGAATRRLLPDGSTLLTWTSSEPLQPGDSATFDFVARQRSASE